MHLVSGNNDAEGLLAAGEWSAVGFVGDENFCASEKRVDFGDGEDDLITVAGGGDDVTGHGLAGHAAAELPAGFGEEIVEKDAFVGSGAPVGGESSRGAGQLGQVFGGKVEWGGDCAFDPEGCGWSARLSSLLLCGGLRRGGVTEFGAEG